jgi:acyl dehydratase
MSAMPRPEAGAVEKPLLTLSTMEPGLAFTPQSVKLDADFVASFSELTGDDSPLYSDPEAARAAGLPGPVVPPGLAGVWARQSYLGAHRMPPGGVMAGQTLTFKAPIPVGAEVVISARVDEFDPEDPRHKVVLACQAADPAGEQLATVRIDARWPGEEQ